MVTMVNMIASKQKELESMEAQKDRIMADNEERSSAKMATTCENGQILMTINNWYMKVSKPGNWQIVSKVKVKEGEEVQPKLQRKEFDDQVIGEQTTLQQLDVIKQFCQSFSLLKDKIRESKILAQKEIQQKMKEKKVVETQQAQKAAAAPENK